MRFLLILVALVLTVGGLASYHHASLGTNAAPASAGPSAGAGRIDVACAPRGGGIRAVRGAIALAREHVRLLGPISGGDQVVDELRAAARRGVQVQLVVPPLTDASSRALAKALLDGGAQVSEDDEHAAMQGDILIIDGDTMVSAASVADAAEQDEVGLVLVVRDARTAATCADIWSVHAAHAQSAGPVRPSRATAANPAAPASSSVPAPAPADASTSLSPFSTSHRQH